MLERLGFGGGTQVAHDLAATGTMTTLAAGVGIGHTGAAQEQLAVSAVPFGGVGRVVMTVGAHGILAWQEVGGASTRIGGGVPFAPNLDEKRSVRQFPRPWEVRGGGAHPQSEDSCVVSMNPGRN